MKYWLVLLCLTLLLVGCQKTLEVRIEVDTSNAPQITITSNLPDGTVFEPEGFEIDSKGIAGESIFFQECALQQGTCTITPTLRNNKPLTPGIYKIQCFIWPPSSQPKAVQKVIGEKGEKMTGACVEKWLNEFWANKTIFMTVKKK